MVDLHGFHPYDEDLYATIRNAIEKAHAEGKSELTIVHGHGLNRATPRPFANTNTGWLGMMVRSILRGAPELRKWMYAKFDCSDIGSTTVRIRKTKREES